MIANLALASLLAVDAMMALASPSPIDRAAGAVMGLLALFALTRPAPRRSDGSAITWGLVLLCLIAPFGYLAAGAIDGSTPATALRWAGLALIATGALSLRRNFALVPQLRQVVTSGPYAIVRHPIYAGYLVFDASHWIGGSRIAMAVWTVELCALAARAALEERCLLADPGYRSYSRRVRGRLIPYVL